MTVAGEQDWEHGYVWCDVLYCVSFLLLVLDWIFLVLPPSGVHEPTDWFTEWIRTSRCRCVPAGVQWKKMLLFIYFLVCVYTYKLSYFSSFRVFLLSHTAHKVKIQVVTAESWVILYGRTPQCYHCPSTHCVIWCNFLLRPKLQSGTDGGETHLPMFLILSLASGGISSSSSL